MSEEKEDPWRLWGVRILSFMASVLTLFLYAYILVDMWTWYFVPLGAPIVGYAHGYGIALTTKLMLRSYPTHKSDPKLKWGRGEKVLVATLGPLFFWAIGAFVHWMWMG